MVRTSKLLISTLLLAFCFLSINLLKAQMVGANCYIKGTSVEIGIAGLGGFEGAPTGVSPPLAGMHFRSGNPFFGFVSNPQVNAWATFDGDFFTPGSPENGWGIELPSGLNYGNNCSYLNQINGAMTSYTTTFSCISATWDGDLTTGTNLHFKINYFLKNTDLFYTTTVSVTNNTAATIPTLYYYRNLDPDNNQPISGDFTTQNTIVAQPFSGACNTAHVKATSLVPASQPMSYFGLAGTGSEFRAYYGGFANRDGSDLWNGVAGFTQAVGSTMFIDGAIGLAYRIQNLAPGATATFKFVCILDDLAAAQAVANTTYLTYPGSATAPPAMCTPYTDTAKICQGVPTAIGVTGPNIASYNWSWSPATGLSATTGATVNASPATTTSYTVTGTPINACFAAISFPLVVQVTPSPTVNPEANVTACAGQVVAANTFTSTPAGATYTWTNSNASIGLAASGSGGLPAFTAVNGTGAPITSTITVTPTIPGSTCPGIPSTFTITINPLPVTTVNSVGICPGQTATLTAGGASTYAWSTGATTNPINVTPAITTTYTVTGTSAAGCTSTAVSTVSIGAAVAISVNTPTICNGAVATLTATGASTYVWNTGATVNPLTVSPTTTTSYTVTGTAAGGCTGTATATVTVNPVPVTTSTSTTICAGQSATLTAGGATTYAWNTGATTAGLTVSPATTTTYTVTGTSLGCSSTAVGTVAVNPVPVTTVNSPTICPGGTATLTAGGATTYAWSTGAATNPINVTPATTTSYTVTGTSLGCTSTAVATVTVGASVTIAVNTPTICAGSSAILTASGASTYVWNTGATANPLTVTPATTTTYTVTGTAVGGCTGTATATVTVNPMPVTTATSTTICAGSTGTLTAGGATSYVWSNGATTAAMNDAPTTTTSYTVTGTSLGCSTTAVGTITVNPLPVTGVNQPFICPTATATLTATGATSYVWSTGATTNPINVTPAGTTSYTVTGTSLGCTSTAVAVVTVGGSITATVNSPTICAGQSATLTATGGTTYSWDTGATTNPLVVTPATTTSYTVTANAGGCTGSAVATVTVNPLPVTTSTNTTICDGSVATLTAGGATTYSWSNGQTTAAMNDSPSTTTSYTVTGTSLGCTSTAVGTVTVNPIPVTTVNSPAICPAATANLTAGGATTYAWTAGVTPTGVNTGDASPAATTTYTVTGTSLGCSSTAVATVTVNAVLAVTTSPDDSVCFGGSAVLSVSPSGVGYSYNWTPTATLTGTTTATPTASPATTTTYSVTLTDPNGCTGTAAVTVFANPQINLSAIVGLPATCFGALDGQTIVIPAGGSGTYPSYSWTGGCTSAACNVGAGTYTVTVTDSWGCTASNSATVTEPTLLTASSVNTQTSCNGVCDGTATATGAGGTTGYTYLWSDPAAQTTATATGLCAGTYTCTITDANGCTTTTSTTIAEPTLVVIAPIADASICLSGTTTLTASASGGNGGAYTYNWTPAGTGSTAAVIVSPTVTTIYTVTANDNNGCPSAPVLVTVNVSSALQVVANGTASICPGASATIDATASFGNGGPYTYTWAPAGGTGSPVTVTPGATTTYTVTASDGCSPTATATVTITILPLPVVAFSTPLPDSCDLHCVTFTNNSVVAGGIATSIFDYGDGSAPSSNPTHCYTVNADGTTGVYDVTLTVSSTIGGCVSSATMPSYITVYPIPNAEFSAPLSTSILSPTVQYNDESTIASPMISTWNWDFGDPFAAASDATSTIQNPSHTFTEAGTFCGTLTVTSNHGCVSTTTHCVVIEPEFTFFIPNAFSPNGDGINDEFFGKGDFITDFEMSIFDRWGNLIFFADDINSHWDGKANHGKELAQQDVYVYVVKLTDNKDKKHKYQGTVTIVK